MSTLIVELPAHRLSPQAELDYVRTPDDGGAPEHGRASVSALPWATEVVALLAPQALSWHVVALPEGLKLHAQSDPLKLRAALAGLLEEQLLDEPEALHMAVFAHPQPQHLWVAVSQLAPLRHNLDLLEQAGLTLARLLPAFAPAIDAPSCLYAMGPQASELVLCHAQGVASLPGTEIGWRFMLAQTPARLASEPAAARACEQHSDQAAPLQTPAQRRVQASLSAWNLAQHSLVLSRRRRWQKQGLQTLHQLARGRAWRPLRVGLTLLVLANMVGLNLVAWREQALLRDKQAQAVALLQSTFPETVLVVDAPAQMARALGQLGQSQGTELGTALHTLGQTLPQARPSGVVFSSTELRLQGLGLEPAQNSRLQAAFAAAGLNAQPQGTDWLIRRGGGP